MPLGHSRIRLMSWLRGSTPKTFPAAFTRRYIPHCTPQKQQWVRTRVCSAWSARQPEAGRPPASRNSRVPGGATAGSSGTGGTGGTGRPVI